MPWLREIALEILRGEILGWNVKKMASFMCKANSPNSQLTEKQTLPFVAQTDFGYKLSSFVLVCKSLILHCPSGLVSHYSPRTVANREVTSAIWNRVGWGTPHSLEKAQALSAPFLERVPFGALVGCISWCFSDIFLLKELNLISSHWIPACHKALS